MTTKPRSVATPVLFDALPPIAEAAMLYANGREAETEEFLRRVLDANARENLEPELWYALFDLLHMRGQWAEYQQLAARFQKQFGKPAPQWVSEEDLARMPESMRPGGPGYFDFGDAIDASLERVADRARVAARNLSGVHLDVSRASRLDEHGCKILLGLLKFLPENGNGLLINGANHLAELVSQAAEGNPTNEVYWNLLLQLYRVRGMQKDFERTAVEYALATEVEPPAWQPIMMPLAPRHVPQEKRDEPRYQAGPEVIYLSGVMWSSTDSQVAELQEFAVDRQYVNINLSELRRIDFSCGNAFAHLLNGLATEGKKVRLIRPNALVAGFLATLNLDANVSIVQPKRPG